MRAIIFVAALLLATGAATAETPRLQPKQPLASALGVCRDRIEQVRTAQGRPKLDRGTGAAEAPLLIAAVDYRLGRCPAMVMYRTGEVRPVPEAPNGPARLRPLR